ncbi:MAG: alpha/beta fold hydrolase [Betaproteobacteria bacterium]|nr:alpha/beta fold hydrolase [Betaproteobacteria bacterium]
MTLLRTPDERFQGLPEWPWAPRYLDDLPGFEGIRVHRVDEPGRLGMPTALLLHGNPTWGYLYRRMIPVFLEAGLRVVAPDLIGFGRSDKPTDAAFHRFAKHRQFLISLIERLDLSNVMLVVQDWGGILGLTLPIAMPQRFTRILAMNTMLPLGEVSEGFLQWRNYCNSTPDLAIGRLLARGCPELTAAEQAAYDAPFPDAHHKAALAAFANMVPDSPEAEGVSIGRQAARFLKEEWSGHSLLAIGQRDPVLGEPVMRLLAATIRGCPEPLLIPKAGHFVQEWGEPIAREALRHFGWI